MLTNSPLADFENYEPRHGLPAGFLRQLNSTNPDTNAWVRHERRDVDEAGFRALFEAETTASTHRVDARDVLDLLEVDLRPAVAAR